MSEHEDSGRHYDPIEPSHGGQDLVRHGASAGAKLHSLVNVLAIVVVLTGAASRFLEGTPYRSPVLLAAIAFVIALGAIYLQRRGQRRREES